MVNDQFAHVPQNPLQAHETAIKLAALLIFGADVSNNPLVLIRMMVEVMPNDLEGFEGMYEDVRTLANRLDDDDAPETTRWTSKR